MDSFYYECTQKKIKLKKMFNYVTRFVAYAVMKWPTTDKRGAKKFEWLIEKQDLTMGLNSSSTPNENNKVLLWSIFVGPYGKA